MYTYIHSCLKFLRRPRVLWFFFLCGSLHEQTSLCTSKQQMFARASKSLRTSKGNVARANCTCKGHGCTCRQRNLHVQNLLAMCPEKNYSFAPWKDHYHWENSKAIPVQRPCSRYLKVMLAIIVRFNTARSDLYLCQKYLKSFQRSISCECANLALF